MAEYRACGWVLPLWANTSHSKVWVVVVQESGASGPVFERNATHLEERDKMNTGLKNKLLIMATAASLAGFGAACSSEEAPAAEEGSAEETAGGEASCSGATEEPAAEEGTTTDEAAAEGGEASCGEGSCG